MKNATARASVMMSKTHALISKVAHLGISNGVGLSWQKE
jgi:hypothetical protein